MADFVPVAQLDEVPENDSIAVEVAGRGILLCKVAGLVHAVENRCSHAFSTWLAGAFGGSYIFCPLHGVRFDLRTGAPSGALTKTPIAVFPVQVIDNQVFVGKEPQ